MDPLELIDRYYHGHKQARSSLLAHSRQVADLAVAITESIGGEENVDKLFIEQAAMLHDIGMLFTDAPALGCHGDALYIEHGIIGAELLIQAGLPRHALVCERHIGVGLSIEDIQTQQLPLPLRDMSPQTVEEQIVAYADLFFSKTKKGMRTADMVRTSLSKYGQYKVEIFNRWHNRFGIP